jgi:RelA/SpoT family (p)ppGpp synthetase
MKRSTTSDGGATRAGRGEDAAGPHPAGPRPGRGTGPAGRRRFDRKVRAGLRAARCQRLADEIAAPATIETLSSQVRGYLPADDVASIEQAYHFAADAHAGQTRVTGHAYITHPLAVASTLAEMHMDATTIQASLLHDVLEDCGVDKELLATRFGRATADIVDGVSRIKQFFTSRADAQAADMYKMAIAMSNDLRVVLLRLADRLHNMRTLGPLRRERRHRIARETLDYYAPIANRIGMHRVMAEMEDLAFEVLHPAWSRYLRQSIEARRGERGRLLREVEDALRGALAAVGIAATVVGREKHLYGIYRTLKREHKRFDEILDLHAFRVIVDTPDTCYRALGAIHNLYKPVFGRFKDYIAIAKRNGYQSLHTDLVGPHGVRIEVQIRTHDMDLFAEHGAAAHFRYKGEAASGSQLRARQWVAGLLDAQRDAGNARDFLDLLKADLFPDEVYVYTPRGKIITLPRGACAVDFAYAVHTEVGNHCLACSIDGVLGSLSTPLGSGQTVHIVTARAPHVNADWMNHVVTPKARAAIRHALRTQDRSQAIAFGRRMLNRALSRHQAQIDSFDFRRLRRVFREFGVRRLDDLLAEIGHGNRPDYVVAQRLVTASAGEAPPRAGGAPGGDIEPLEIAGNLVENVAYARCCGPVPGDPVLAHVSRGRGLTVHIADCKNVRAVHRRTPDDIVPVTWSASSGREFVSALHIEVRRYRGVIAEMAGIVRNCEVGIEQVHVAERNAEVSTVIMDLLVAGRSDLARVMRSLHRLPAVYRLSRLRR